MEFATSRLSQNRQLPIASTLVNVIEENRYILEHDVEGDNAFDDCRSRFRTSNIEYYPNLYVHSWYYAKFDRLSYYY